MRTADDPDLVEYQGYLQSMRDLTAEQPVPDSFIARLKPLSAADVKADKAWACAPIGVCSKLERDDLGLQQARAFARMHGRVLVRWPRTLVGKAAEWLDADQTMALAENEPGLMFNFVVGAPAMLLSNAAGQPTKHLANGSPAEFHSLTFQGDTPDAYAAALQRGGFSEVVLDTPPLSVNIVPKLEQRADNYGIESLLPDQLVVAVLKETAWREDHTCVSLFVMADRTLPKALQYTGHPVTCALTLTNFKMQGGSFSKLIVSVHSKPFPPHLNLEAFYVFASRPHSLDGLRVLVHESGLNNLKGLRHAPELAIWDRGYDPQGHWSAEQAKAAAADVADAAASQPRRKPAPRSAAAKKEVSARVDAAVHRTAQKHGLPVGSETAQPHKKRKAKAKAAVRMLEVPYPPAPTEDDVHGLPNDSMQGDWHDDLLDDSMQGDWHDDALDDCMQGDWHGDALDDYLPHSWHDDVMDECMRDWHDDVVDDCMSLKVAAAKRPTVSMLEDGVAAALNKEFSRDVDEIPYQQLVNELRAANPTWQIETEAVERVLKAMEDANKVMHREGQIHLI